MLWFAQVKLLPRPGNTQTHMVFFVYFQHWKPHKLHVWAWIKDQVGFPVGEVGTVASNRSLDKLSVLLEWLKQTQTFFFSYLMFITVQKREEWLWIDRGCVPLFSPLRSTGLKCQRDSTIHVNVMSFMAFHRIRVEWSSKVIISQTIYGYTAVCGLGQRQ